MVNGQFWAVVLAANEGRGRAHARFRPALLDETLSRAAAVAPRERICVVVAHEHHRGLVGPLWTVPASNVVTQPERSGTAHGILLALLRIVDRDPAACVMLLPSTHHVLDEMSFRRSLRAAAAHAAARTDEVFVVGVEPDAAEGGYAYVVPGRADGLGAFSVTRFVEKPETARVLHLIERRALWNTGIVTASAHRLLHVFERRVPAVVAKVREALRPDRYDRVDFLKVAEVLKRLPYLDLQRDVLDAEERHVRVLSIPRSGWSDLYIRYDGREAGPGTALDELAGRPRHAAPASRGAE